MQYRFTAHLRLLFVATWLAATLSGSQIASAFSFGESSRFVIFEQADSSGELRGSAPYDILVLGDSRTEAIFSDIELGLVKTRADELKERALAMALGGLMTVSLPLPKDGELATSRPHMKRVEALFARKSVSGLLGRESYSVGPQIAGRLGRTVRIAEFAEPGLSFSVARAELLQEIFSFSERHNLKPQLILIQLGAVDFLLNRPSETFQSDVQETLSGLALGFPEASIYAEELPPIVRLFMEGDKPANFDRSGQVKSTCQDAYESFGYGVALGLVDGIRSPQSTIDFQNNRLSVFNQALADFLENSQSPVTSRGRFVRIPRVENVHAFLAFDCLHPNRLGQAQTGTAFLNAIEDFEGHRPR